MNDEWRGVYAGLGVIIQSFITHASATHIVSEGFATAQGAARWSSRYDIEQRRFNSGG
jgi:hypothetical protein